jgi:hypothetical protein
MSSNNIEENINHNILNEKIIDKEELIEYLTYILEHDGEVDKFYERNNFEEQPSPENILDFREWLKKEPFIMVEKGERRKMLSIMFFVFIQEDKDLWV